MVHLMIVDCVAVIQNFWKFSPDFFALFSSIQHSCPIDVVQLKKKVFLLPSYQVVRPFKPLYIRPEAPKLIRPNVHLGPAAEDPSSTNYKIGNVTFWSKSKLTRVWSSQWRRSVGHRLPSPAMPSSPTRISCKIYFIDFVIIIITTATPQLHLHPAGVPKIQFLVSLQNGFSYHISWYSIIIIIYL